MVRGARLGSLKSGGHRLWWGTDWPSLASLAGRQECRAPGHPPLAQQPVPGGVSGDSGKMEPRHSALGPVEPRTDWVAQPHHFCCLRVTIISISKFEGPLLSLACFGEVCELDQEQVQVA